MPRRLRFVPGTDFTGTHRRLTGAFGEDRFGSLRWGSLTLAVVRLEERRFVALDTPPGEWQIPQSLEGFTIEPMSKYSPEPEGTKEV